MLKLLISPKSHLYRITAALWFANVASPALAQQIPSPGELAKRVSQKYQEVTSYVFDGDIEVGRKSGEDKPRDVLSKAHVILSAAKGKYVLRVQYPGEAEYIEQSNGEAIWTTIPSLNEYAVQEAKQVQPARFSVATTLDSVPESRIPVEFARLVMPILSNVSEIAGLVDLRGSLLTVLSKTGPEGRQTLVYLSLDTTTLAIRRLAWTTARSSADGDKSLLRSDIVFRKFEINAAIDDAIFTFHAPAGAKQVKSVALASSPR